MSGATLHDLFEDEDPAIGDFVRNARQLVDLLRQIEESGVLEPAQVRRAIDGIDRGMVAAAGAV